MKRRGRRGKCGEKDEGKASVMNKKRKSVKEPLAGGTMAKNCWAKSTKDKGNRAGKMVKIADLHKTQGYPRPLFPPPRRGRSEMLRRYEGKAAVQRI